MRKLIPFNQQMEKKKKSLKREITSLVLQYTDLGRKRQKKIFHCFIIIQFIAQIYIQNHCLMVIKMKFIPRMCAFYSEKEKNRIFFFYS